ncbi:MAG TPA: radical SAM protein [Myxococcota bacterium]|nr:radical SAM protein [Myxococcota bacterium]
MKTAAYKLLTRALSRTLRTPQYLILFLSDSCWMKCAHCWFSEAWKAEHLTERQLSFDELSRMADSISRITFLSMTGGEAFARSDVVEIAEMFARKTKLARYQIPTSGFKPDLIVPRAEKMLRRNPDTPFRVDVSLDGTREVHERIRQVAGGFDRLVDTLRGLNALKRRYAHFDVGVITTISTHNQHQVEEIAKLAEQLNPDGEWMVNITRGETRDPSSIDVDLASYDLAHRLIEQRIAEGRYRGHTGHLTASWLSAKNASRRKVIHDTVAGRTRGGGCAAGSLGGVIYSDGAVHACELLDDPLGNIRDFDYDLAALWNAPAADALRNWIQDTRCQCTQECFLSVSFLIQPNRWPDIVRERMRLRRSAARSPLLELEGPPS